MCAEGKPAVLRFANSSLLYVVQRKSGLLSRHNKPTYQRREPPVSPSVSLIHSNEASSDNKFIQDQKLYLAIFKQVHTSTAKSISVLPSARRVALVTFYVKQELPPDLEVHQEFC